MSTASEIIRKRRKKRRNDQRSFFSKLTIWGRGSVLVICLLGLFAGGWLTWTTHQLTTDLPSTEVLPLLLGDIGGHLYQPTRLYDRTGEIVIYSLDNPVSAPRLPLPLGQRDEGQFGDYIPTVLAQAVVSAIDPDFWSHPGFYWNALTDPRPQTITHHLVSDLLTWDEPIGSRRTLREQILAAQITNQFGREQILTWYINSANYGKLAYGASAASHTYFDKDANTLTLGEAALLAAAIQAPALNPVDTPIVALERQADVLAQMVALGFITSTEAAQARQASLTIQSLPAKVISPYEAAAQLALEQIAPHISRERLERGGIKIITTIDAPLLTQMHCGVLTQLTRLEGNSSDDTLLSDCETARLLPNPPVISRPAGIPLSGTAAILDPATGQVLAIVSTNSLGENVIRLGTHPPGSLLTPYVYLNAFTRGFSPASLVWDVPAAGEDTFAPTDGEYHGPMRMRTALANDYLGPAVQLLTQMGAENVWQTARQVGLPSLTIAAGQASQDLLFTGGPIPVIEAAAAFGSLSTQGVQVGYALDAAQANANPEGLPTLSPTIVLRAVDLSGQFLFNIGPPEARPLVSAHLAYILTDILSDESTRWPSLGHPNTLEIGRPAAVKTGRTSAGNDIWAVGFTPQIVVGVWIGQPGIQSDGAFIDPLPAIAAGGLWNALTKQAVQDLPAETWSLPPGISFIEVCDPSGMLPTEDCPGVAREIFLPGTEPTQYDTLFQRFQINRETGALATVFTPPGLIEEHVFMVVPASAAAWAQAAGLPTPPETYDLVSAPTNSPGIRITSPAMFATVSGVVSISGTAATEDFSSYQVQAGQGLNPQQWVQIGDAGEDPVESNELAVWNTTGLSGLYALRLQVVGDEQRIETAIIQVTVDNTAPEVTIGYPGHGTEVFYIPGKEIILQVDAQDALGLDKVTFSMDQVHIAALSQPPFVAAWEMTAGTHTLTARAYDNAGNMTEVTSTFTVSP